MPAAESRPLIGHGVEQLLALSEAFIYGYLSHLRQTRAVVFASGRANETLFPFGPVDLYWRQPPFPVRALLRAGRQFDPALEARLQGALLAARVWLRQPQLIHAHFGNIGIRALR